MATHASDALPVTPPPEASWLQLWARLAVRGAALVALVFVAYEVVERAWLQGVDATTLHALHIARGTGTAFLLATWSFLTIRRERAAWDRRVHAELEAATRARAEERTRKLEETRAFIELLSSSLREHAARDLRERQEPPSKEPAPAPAEDDPNLERAVLAFQRAHIARVLDRVGGNREAAARALGLSPATFYRYLARVGLKGYRVVDGGRAAERE
jgi:hypothetical protein